MTKKDKLKAALAGISYYDSKLGSSLGSIEKQLKSTADKIRTDKEVKSLQDVKDQVAGTLRAFMNSLDDLRGELNQKDKSLTDALDKKLSSLRSAISQIDLVEAGTVQSLSDEVDRLRSEISRISQQKTDIPDFSSQIAALKQEIGREMDSLRLEESEESADDFKARMDEIEKSIGEIRKRSLTITGHGGQANRNILVGGNSSTLSRYTDLNIKAGANVTLTYTSNNTLKTTDLTIAATGGGGGSVIGTTRSISTISTSQTAGSTTNTDYVYICTTGLQLTLPDAASNTNLYTVKNTSTSSVMVTTTGGQTIDTAANIILPIQYTSVDLVSDNTNWDVT